MPQFHVCMPSMYQLRRKGSAILLVSSMQSFPWHTKTALNVLEELHSHEYGLTQEEAGERFEKYGVNKLPEKKADGFLLIFLRQFQSPLIYILLAASATVLWMGETVDASIIFFVLLFNAIVGTFQEGKAQNAILALRKFSETSATVVRDGKERIIPDAEIVMGDIILLQEGEKVPADARVISANTLKIDEASLTGESVPVTKTEAVVPIDTLPITEQKNILFKGTNVLSGNGIAVVVATGFATEIGKIAQKISTIDT